MERAEARLDSVPASGLPPLIDELAALAGDYFGSIAALTGAAYKSELSLARFCRRHLGRLLQDGHMPLLAGLTAPTDAGHHAVVSLDWWHAPAPSAGQTSHVDVDVHLVETRLAAETAAGEALASSPRRLRAFRTLLADTQHLVMVREEQVRDFTLAWPVMRRAVLRIGEELVDDGFLDEYDDVFFLTRDEALGALGGRTAPAVDVAERRRIRAEQARLVPPLLVGSVNPMVKRVWDAVPGMMGAVPSQTALVSGAPASPGRATGRVRLIRGPEDFGALQPGEILVAPLTAPAWTPLFTRAAAVVTDVGSAASHASIIAREYGIPAIVGCADATARLQTGMCVTVDGSRGNVEPASDARQPAPRL